MRLSSVFRIECARALLLEATEVHFEAAGRFVQVTLGNDVVAIEDRPCLVPRDRHCHALRNACPYHVPYSSASKIVEEPSRYAGAFAG